MKPPKKQTPEQAQRFTNENITNIHFHSLPIKPFIPKESVRYTATWPNSRGTNITVQYTEHILAEFSWHTQFSPEVWVICTDHDKC